EARADEKERQRNDERRRRCHQAVGDDAVIEGMTRRAENGKGSHVGTKKGQEKDVLPERTARQKIVFGAVSRAAEGKDTDIKDNAEIEKNKNGRNQRASSSSPRCVASSASSSRCEGQA